MSAAFQALRDAGLSFTEIVADGRFHRARKPNDAQWYVANEGTTSTGKQWLMLSGGDFRETGGEHKATVVWRSWRKGDLSKSELKEISHQHKTAKDRAQQALTKEQEEARHTAMRIWRHADPGRHSYLDKKRLHPGNTKVSGRALLIPLYSLEGAFTTLQEILPDGSKKFLPRGRFIGTYHPINYFFGTEPKVYIAEGWATAAAIAKVKDVPVVAAFSAANLVHVAKGIRRERPDIEIVIAADNDTWTKNNPGVAKANKAAAAVGGKIIVPDFSRLPLEGKPTDWWDYFNLTGAL